MEALTVLTRAAERRGFLVYKAPSRLPQSSRAGFENWLAAGMHADMKYLARDPLERYDPVRRFSWFKGALVLAVPYGGGEVSRPVDGLRLGKVARYAWVRDYHLWIAPLLADLEELCRKLGGTCKGYVDYGPIPERAYAVASGGGWLGRNGLWLTQENGSYQYLAILLTSWEVEPAPPHPNRCGSCTACVGSCPTGAIVADGVVDSRRCLSYWTIEYRGLIPQDIWDRMGNWVFGCDDCQTPCPWNRRADGWKLEPDPDLAWPDLGSFFGVSNRVFARRYHGSAFLRSGRPAMARNALIALSNSDQDALRWLLPAALADPSEKVRATAAAAAARIGAPDLAGKAMESLDGEAREYVEGFLRLLSG